MVNKTKVAYIITVYNVNKYLKECLDSVAKIESSKEVIIVDDCGSEDPTAIVFPFLKNNSFKYYKNEKNLGIGPSRNIGISLISSDTSHIYFVDGDDFVDSEKIDEIYRSIEIERTYLITEYVRVTKKTREISNIKSFSLSDFPLVVWGTFWSAKIAKQTPFSLRAYEDGPWVVEYFSNISDKSKIVFLPNSTYFYRKRISSIVNSDKDLQTAIDRINSFKFVYQSKMFGWNSTKVEEVIFQYLSIKRSERKNISLNTFNIRLFQRVWFTLAFYMQKMIRLDKMLWKKYRKDFFE